MSAKIKTPQIPRGSSELRDGDLIKKGDRSWKGGCGPFKPVSYAVIGQHYRVEGYHYTIIRKLTPKKKAKK